LTFCFSHAQTKPLCASFSQREAQPLSTDDGYVQKDATFYTAIVFVFIAQFVSDALKRVHIIPGLLPKVKIEMKAKSQKILN
jgi:hypothetical protein